MVLHKKRYTLMKYIMPNENLFDYFFIGAGVLGVSFQTI